MTKTTPRIGRIVLRRLIVPVPIERVNSPQFFDETLQRADDGSLYGPWFGSVPIVVATVVGKDGTRGCCDMLRGTDLRHVAELSRALIGMSVEDVYAKKGLLGEEAVPRGLHAAVLDWKARQLGVPLWELFGNQVRSRVPIAAWSGHHTPEDARSVAIVARSKGLHGLKLKSNPRSDEAGITRAVLESCGPAFHLVIDPNGRWETIEESIRRGNLVHDANPHTWIEDPTYSDRERWAEIARATGLRLICTVIGARRVQEVAGIGISALNLVGPWPDLIQASREASAVGLPFWAGSSVDTGLSDLAMLHFALTQPAFTLPMELAGSQTREHSLLSAPIPIIEGCAQPPAGDGMGIEPDYDAIERYTTETIILDSQ